MPTGYLRDPTSGHWEAVELTPEIVRFDRPYWHDNTDYLYMRNGVVVLATFIGAKSRKYACYSERADHCWSHIMHWYGRVEEARTPVVVYAVPHSRICISGAMSDIQFADINPSMILYAAIPSLSTVIPPASTTVLHGQIGRLAMRTMNVPEFVCDRTRRLHCTFEITLCQSRTVIRQCGILHIIVYGKAFDKGRCKNINYYGGDRADYVRKCIRDMVYDNVDHYGDCEYIVFQTANVGDYNNPMPVNLSTSCIAAFYDCMHDEDIATYESSVIVGV